MTEHDKAWSDLVRKVNARRYRGVNEPMRDNFYWPLEINYMDDISQAALRLVVAAERKAANDSR